MSDSRSKRPQRNRAAASDAPDLSQPVVIEPAAALKPAAAARPVDEAPGCEPASNPAEDVPEDAFAIGRTALCALAESQAALARGLEAIAVEAAALVRSGMSAAADAGSAMLGARTFADAIEVQAGFARRSIDAALDGSARLSEITVKTTAEVSRPIQARLDDAWQRVG